jgi:hypothetical protein
MERSLFVDCFTDELQLGTTYFFKNVEFELAQVGSSSMHGKYLTLHIF